MLFDILYPPELLEALSLKMAQTRDTDRRVAIRIQTISVQAVKETAAGLKPAAAYIIPGLGGDDLVVCFLEYGGFTFFNVILGVDEAFPLGIIETHEVTTVVETGVTGLFTEFNVLHVQAYSPQSVELLPAAHEFVEVTSSQFSGVFFEHFEKMETGVQEGFRGNVHGTNTTTVFISCLNKAHHEVFWE